ncbi:hypothetical protein KIK06_23530 [Nocardiopsis sp. EMB25]|uniref:hypothetical protein n=1 Tax=Nocardiopsis sp. EMB25 TaxID=2835867 RepID=UPI002284832E|nr:hypothetical protein [Nocardiopsis sp. EMB25]MCY9786859.1 hypothetical protein [Nocardiopsis sp. EMB25]
MHTSTHNSTSPTVTWVTHPHPNGGDFTTAHLGEITVNGHTITVMVQLDPDWTARNGSGPALLTTPEGMTVLFIAATRDINPDELLAAAPDTVARYRPEFAQGAVA